MKIGACHDGWNSLCVVRCHNLLNVLQTTTSSSFEWSSFLLLIMDKVGYASYKAKSSKKLVSLWRVIDKTCYASKTCRTCYNNRNHHKAENFELFRATFNSACFWVTHNGNIFVIRCLRLKIAEFVTDIEFTIVKVIWPVLEIFLKIGFSSHLQLVGLFLVWISYIKNAGCVKTSKIWYKQRNHH